MLIPFKELFARHKIKTRQVLHVGANTGQEAEEYIRQGVIRIVWIEAHRPTYKRLVEDMARIGRCEHICLCACIGDVDGKEVTFNIANNGCQSSSILEFGTHSVEHPTVKFVGKETMMMERLDTLMREEGIEFEPGSFLNIDLQGAELMALRGLGDLLDRFDHLYLEVNQRELYKGCPLVADIDHFLHERGFIGRQTKMTGNGWGDKYYQRI